MPSDLRVKPRPRTMILRERKRPSDNQSSIEKLLRKFQNQKRIRQNQILKMNIPTIMDSREWRSSEHTSTTEYRIHRSRLKNEEKNTLFLREDCRYMCSPSLDRDGTEMKKKLDAIRRNQTCDKMKSKLLLDFFLRKRVICKRNYRSLKW